MSVFTKWIIRIRKKSFHIIFGLFGGITIHFILSCIQIVFWGLNYKFGWLSINKIVNRTGWQYFVDCWILKKILFKFVKNSSINNISVFALFSIFQPTMNLLYATWQTMMTYFDNHTVFVAKFSDWLRDGLQHKSSHFTWMIQKCVKCQ